jgi:asparaginyl-tRNA synthetase
MSIAQHLVESMSEDDESFSKVVKSYSVPIYDPVTHFLEVTRNDYFRALTVLRHYIKTLSDYYFSTLVGAKNIDLFMLTPSISSPTGPGSDSQAIPIMFGKYHTNLVDSSQFGFEPILLNGFDKVYCYLPSMRGEDPDKRHLNQFYHCEAEIVGTLDSLIPIIEDYIKFFAESFEYLPNVVRVLSKNYETSKLAFDRILKQESFPRIQFNDAVDTLKKMGSADLVERNSFGVNITAEGEVMLATINRFTTPFWIENYDRDNVPFYQKPHEGNSDKVINADLIFPPLLEGSFGGEVVGCGQRQDNEEEMLESMRRQGVDPESYMWYINLRNQPNYSTTSGFGLGVERFITWFLGRDDIKDSILYPRMKDVKTYP